MPEGLPDINLLPQYERHSSAALFAYILFLLLTIAAFIFIGVFYFITKGKIDTVDAELEELRQEEEVLLGQLQIKEEAGSSSLENAVQFVEYYTIPTSLLITELDELLPNQTYLKSYQYASQVVTIVTHTERLSTVAEYTRSLTNSDYLLDTKVDGVDTFEVKEEVIGDEVNFNIVPRFEARFTLDLDKRHLKEAAAEDE